MRFSPTSWLLLFPLLLFCAACGDNPTPNQQTTPPTERRTTPPDERTTPPDERTTPPVTLPKEDPQKKEQDSIRYALIGHACPVKNQKDVLVYVYTQDTDETNRELLKVAPTTLLPGRFLGNSTAEIQYTVINQDVPCDESAVHFFQVDLDIVEARLAIGKTFVIELVSTSKEDGSLTKTTYKGSLTQQAKNVGIVGSFAAPQLINGVYKIRGWGCDIGHKKSIDVHIYLDGPYGTGTGFKTTTASLTSEAAVGTNCGTGTFNKHRFEITLTTSDLHTHVGRKLYIHGISTSGGSHLQLRGSGQYTIPSADALPTVIGNVARITRSGHRSYLEGWACNKNVNQSIQVHIFAGGAYKSPGAVNLGATTANLPSHRDINGDCGTSSTPHNFKFPLTPQQVKAHKGKKLYVHGISTTGGENKLLSNSGSQTVPTFYAGTFQELLDLGIITTDNATSKDYTIPANTQAVLHKNHTVGLLHVHGVLQCGPFNITLKTDGIMVHGNTAKLLCGTANARHEKQFYIELKGRRAFPSNTKNIRSVSAMEGGTIQLHGRKPNHIWAKLTNTIGSVNTKATTTSPAAPANVGSCPKNRTSFRQQRKIVLSKTVNWQEGRLIAIAATSFNFRESEQFKLCEIEADKKTIYLDRVPTYQHWGATQTFTQGSNSWTLDERAEVVLLSRNIKITSALTATDRQEGFGGHVMIMPRSFAYIDSVEFINLGQMGVLARYPFHWHRLKNASGQYIQNSSIRNSFQRCITVHGTQHARVERNSCFNHFGHGYFLEDGDETNNIIRYNIGMWSKRVPNKDKALLPSDHSSSRPQAFSAPSTFWISHPNNTVTHNIAAGSQGTGIWFAFASSFGTIQPNRASFGSGDNNTAHSNEVGITFDGGNVQTEANGSTSVANSHYWYHQGSISDLTLYKNARTGFWYRGNYMLVENSILADNVVGSIFSFNQEMKNSLYVGLSNNHDNARDFGFVKTLHGQGHYIPFRATFLYDGPLYHNGNHYAAYNSSKLTYDGSDLTPQVFALFGGDREASNHMLKDLTFSPNPIKKFVLPQSIKWATILLDEGGNTFTNSQKGYSIVPSHPINRFSDCKKISDYGGHVCPRRYLGVHIHRYGGRYYKQFSVLRYDDGDDTNNNGASDANYTAPANFPSHPEKNETMNKISLVANTNYIYQIKPIDGLTALPKKVDFTLLYAKQDDRTSIIKIPVTSNACTLSGAQLVKSLAVVKGTHNTSTYYKSGKTLYFRIVATNKVLDQTDRGSQHSPYNYTYKVTLNCP